LIVAAVLPIPAVRRAVARVLPIDPTSSVHATALSLVGGALVISFGQLIASGGSPALLNLVETMPDASTGTAEGQDLLLTVYAFAWTVPCALVAGGWPMVRSFGATLQRLGLVVPTWRQVVAAIVIALLMVGGAFALDAGISRLWNLMGWQTTNSAAFEKLLGSLISPIGAVVIGITAGVGEEMVVRGVLQPRLGILVSNLFFVGLHAFQYGFDALLSVFIIGLILGIIRARSNTTTSAIVHGTYDFVLVMMSALEIS
jgi:membrane protease YdiL (CAAX protease family)